MKLRAYCEKPFQDLKVNCEGDAMNCCGQPQGVLGNLITQELDEIWNGEKLQSFKKAVIDGIIHPQCSQYFCPYFYQDLSEAMQDVEDDNHPILLELDLPNYHCNIGGNNPGPDTACIMCYRSDARFKAQTDKLQEVCNKLRGVMSHITTLHIQGMAEPFFKGKLFDVLDWLDYDNYVKNNQNLVVSTITNGTLLNADIRKKLFSRCPRTNVCFSMDAGSADTYKKIRRGKYDVVKQNLIEFGKERDKTNHALRISNNINLLNIGECAQMVKDAHEAQVDIAWFFPTANFNNTVSSITVNRHNYELFEAAQREIIEVAAQLGVRVGFHKPLHLNLGQT